MSATPDCPKPPQVFPYETSKLTEPAAVLRELYASEINVRFESAWDAGVHWRVGDQYNGYVGTGTAEDWDSAIFEAADYAAGYHEYNGFNAWWFSGARANYWPKQPEPTPTT